MITCAGCGDVRPESEMACRRCGSSVIVPAAGVQPLGAPALHPNPDEVTPGWKPDPEDPTRWRWWDGYAWGVRSDGWAAGDAVPNGGGVVAPTPYATVARSSGKLRTGLPVGVAIAMSIVSAQAWGAIVYGFLAALFGAFVADFDNSFNSFCSPYDPTCTSESLNDVGSRFTMYGIVALLVGIALVAAVVATMMGNPFGRGACIAAQVVVILLVLWVALGSGSILSAILGAAFPAIALLGLANTAASQFFRDCEPHTRPR